jgi:glyoxylase-like metal-dependent hydrolase (beta-lactamase superfamily II)
LADAVDTIADETGRPKFVYPFAEAPERGGAAAVDVAPGVKWLRIPIEGDLGFINVWAIEEAGGWAIVDTGMGGAVSAQAWRRAFNGPLAGRPPTRIFVTHMHPDHIGMSGWLTRKYDCRLWTTRLEFVTCRSLVADTGREAPLDGVRFYRAAGWTEEQIEVYRSRFGFFGKLMHPLPDSFHRLRDGDEIVLGGRLWRIVVGSGHSPEHACLYCPELKLLISGDQVLPKISSNVSVFPLEPDADPLNDWMSSLARIKGLVPDDVLVLPAHNEPFRGLHARIDDLIGGHLKRLERMRRMLAQPKRVVDLFGALFRARIDDMLRTMATGECLAHLNYLVARGEVVRTRDDQGVDWYRAAA